MFKTSVYNIIIPGLSDNEKTCIYNSKSGAIINLETKAYHDLCELKFDSAPLNEYIPELLKQGIIVSEDKDERQEILFEIRAKQYEKTGMLSLVIAPTLQCNYKCIYCFENNQLSLTSKMMCKEEIDNILKFVRHYLDKYPQTKKIYIHWFGGEPLLAFENIIQPLSKKIINFTKENKIEYGSGIVTNGYLLTEDAIKLLIEECLVTDFQITFDGIENNYVRMKCPPTDAYERTKSNIFSLSEYISTTSYSISVNIRINTDKTNFDDAQLFTTEIKQNPRYKNNFRFYLGRIRGVATSFDVQEFECCENKFNDFMNKAPRFFNPKKIWCNQFTFNSFCIGPYGELYKCEHDFGCSERVIGDLKNGLYYNDYLNKYMNQSIANCCNECKIFPICLGGCPNYKFHSGSNHSCEYTLNNIIQQIEKYVRSVQAR